MRLGTQMEASASLTPNKNTKHEQATSAISKKKVMVSQSLRKKMNANSRSRGLASMLAQCAITILMSTG